ncbi:hypothetical protein B4092_4771 [Bacillus licheniformis]|nr:hypothetical protein B4092_4771 [Bacillus licheniformis]NFT30569.1 hypothetical protein [Clostridium sporogenes]OJT57320.1 hypothetical protein BFP47_11465 [Bacillus licheniformis]OJT70038.1 hypothetical protein BFP46_05425 [Bacillus licheniformis]TWM14723.1 hypothetical protein CHCC15091_1764 [Bacillus licheniformis]
MIFILRFLSILLILLLVLFLVGKYLPFLGMPIWIGLFIALILCLYFAIKFELKKLKNGKE